MPVEKSIETDVLIIGGGVAGLFAAMTARQHGLHVIIVDKGYAGRSGASIMASGFWTVFNTEWGQDFDAVLAEVNRSSEYLNNREWSEIVLKESLTTYEDLIRWGIEFPVEAGKMKAFLDDRIRTASRHLSLPDVPAPAHVPLFYRGTTPPLRSQAEKVGVKIIDRVVITDLVKQDGVVAGAVGFPAESYDFYVFKAKATILCGGRNAFKPPGMHISGITGDADGMAYRAGAEITGKEFPDLHTGLALHPSWKSSGEMYVPYWHYSDAEGKHVVLAGMDLCTVAAVHAGRGPIYWDLDAATPEDIEAMEKYKRKRGVPQETERVGLDPRRGGKYQVTGGSAAGGWEEQTGGLWPINTECESSLPGLYAAGDCCCTWCWGATVALPGGGLTPAAVTGKRAATGAAKFALKAAMPAIGEEQLSSLRKAMYLPVDRKGGFSPAWVTQLLQNTMMPYFILHIKHEKRLQAALTYVEFLRDHLVPKLTATDSHELRLAHETKNMVLNAEMILRSSLFRTESRGHHYREDYPERDDANWLAWIKMKDEQGTMKLWKEPIPQEWRPDSSKPSEELYYPRLFALE